MKSNSPKNVKNTSLDPEFEIGDLVCYIYQTSSDLNPQIGLVMQVNKVEISLIEESQFVEHYYEYDVLWTNQTHVSVMFEMFLKKYEYQK